MRCLAFEQHWRHAGGHSVFVTCMNTPSIKARLQLEGIETIQLPINPGSIDDAKQTINLAKKTSASWIVVDGYHFDSNYQQIIKDSGLNLLLIDDNGSAVHYYADILLNQNVHADENLYSSREPFTCLLLGTRYALLREEFLRWQGWKREIPETARNLLVTLGGSDPENVTQKVIQAINQTKFNNLNVIIVAANNQYYEELESEVQKSKVTIKLKRNVLSMSDLMAWADMAVSAGGTSTWELAFMGLPMLTIAIADNQCQIVEELSKAGVALNLGWHQNTTSFGIAKVISKLLEDVGMRAEMSRRGQILVDGKGADRVLAQIKRVHSQCKEKIL